MIYCVVQSKMLKRQCGYTVHAFSVKGKGIVECLVIKDKFTASAYTAVVVFKESDEMLTSTLGIIENRKLLTSLLSF